MAKPVLSILVVTHNQRSLLGRCLSSLFTQSLNVPFEIIVSDDRSTDGTKEYVEEMANRSVGTVVNLISLEYYFCDSDQCHPTNTSERCGWNKLNAYLHAKGKYFVNIDADDYLRSKDIYQMQVSALEAHPKCSMCMQRILTLEDGDSFESGSVWPLDSSLIDGAIISKEDCILRNLRSLNQGFMIRRHPENKMEILYGKWFDDTIITYHHLQYGPIIFIDRADYVWVHYPSSISHSMGDDDKTIVYGLLPIHHANLIPSMETLFLKNGLPIMVHMMKVAPEFPDLSEQYRDYLSQFDGFIFRYYTGTRHSILTKIRFNTVHMLLLFMNKFKCTSKVWLNLAKRALLN